MKNWFVNIDCSEELRKQYFALAKKFHSDINGGNDEEMKEINSQYADLYKIWKDVHINTKEDVKEKTYTAKVQCKEAPEDFINIISTLLNMEGVDVELCGRWLWIGGNTKSYKEELKKIGCKWSPSKKLWSWHFQEDSVTPWHKKAWTMDAIRVSYGSEKFKKDEEQLKLVG